MHILGVILVIGFLLFLIGRRSSEFSILVKRGRVDTIKGNVSRAIVNDFAETVGNVANGEIIGNRNGKAIRLSFKGDIDEFTQQRLRNIYGLHNR